MISPYFCIQWLFCWFAFQKSGSATSLVIKLVFNTDHERYFADTESLIKNGQQQSKAIPLLSKV